MDVRSFYLHDFNRCYLIDLLVYFNEAYLYNSALCVVCEEYNRK